MLNETFSVIFKHCAAASVYISTVVLFILRLLLKLLSQAEQEFVIAWKSFMSNPSCGPPILETEPYEACNKSSVDMATNIRIWGNRRSLKETRCLDWHQNFHIISVKRRSNIIQTQRFFPTWTLTLWTLIPPKSNISWFFNFLILGGIRVQMRLLSGKSR